MNLLPSDLPHPADATSLSKPGFDILLAVSRARQAALPTVRLLRERETDELHAAAVGAVREMLGGGVQALDDGMLRPARFFDLSDEANGLPETVNSAFTRGFQPMLNPSSIKARTSALPIPHDEDFME